MKFGNAYLKVMVQVVSKLDKLHFDMGNIIQGTFIVFRSIKRSCLINLLTMGIVGIVDDSS